MKPDPTLDAIVGVIRDWNRGIVGDTKAVAEIAVLIHEREGRDAAVRNMREALEKLAS